MAVVSFPGHCLSSDSGTPLSGLVSCFPDGCFRIGPAGAPCLPGLFPPWSLSLLRAPLPLGSSSQSLSMEEPARDSQVAVFNLASPVNHRVPGDA